MGSEELDRVRERYARRQVGESNAYSMLQPATWQMLQERQRQLLLLLARRGFTTLESTTLLEVGCGTGGNLLEFLRLGCLPRSLTGIELLPDRVAKARQSLPAGIRIISGDALLAEVEHESQDIVFQAVVFSSLLDDAFQRELANVMWSWVRPGGAVLWYDFVYDNPSNPDVRGVPVSRVRELFPTGNFEIVKLTLAPPVARRVVKIHPALYTVFNLIPMLRTHRLCWIEKP